MIYGNILRILRKNALKIWGNSTRKHKFGLCNIVWHLSNSGALVRNLIQSGFCVLMCIFSWLSVAVYLIAWKHSALRWLVCVEWDIKLYSLTLCCHISRVLSVLGYLENVLNICLLNLNAVSGLSSSLQKSYLRTANGLATATFCFCFTVTGRLWRYLQFSGLLGRDFYMPDECSVLSHDQFVEFV